MPLVCDIFILKNMFSFCTGLSLLMGLKQCDTGEEISIPEFVFSSKSRNRDSPNA